MFLTFLFLPATRHGKDGKIFISNLDLREMAAIDLQETSLCQLCILKASTINSSIPDSLFYIFVPNVFHLYRVIFRATMLKNVFSFDTYLVGRFMLTMD